MGGGTPSLFSAEQIQRLLKGVERQLAFSDEIEVTLEANPGTFESNKFSDYRSIGVNRLSIGVQSFHNEHLKRLGRIHSGEEAKAAITIAKQVGFDNFNLDFMFGLPESGQQDSYQDLQQAIAFNPTHLSFYQLTLEPNTYFHKYPPQLPDDDAIFKAQLTCQKLLADNGYQQYEISAYAQKNQQSRHNLNYWSFGDYLGIGAGAHGKISLHLPHKIVRTSKAKQPEQYLKLLKNDRPEKTILQEELPLEFIMNNLRLKAGFTVDNFMQSTGLHFDVLQTALQQCQQQGLLDIVDNHYRCSEQGWFFLDSILEKFS
jgi:oxygen-independent coproporphyrinogen-3 oxidase